MRRHRPRWTVIACILAVLSIASAGATTAPTPGPILRAQDREVPTTQDFRWAVGIRIFNRTTQGAYTDSLTVEAQDLSKGVTHGPRSNRFSIGYVSRQLPAIGTMDSSFMSFASAASYETARLVFRYYTHDAAGHHAMTADTVVMRPNEFSQENPSLSFRSDSTNIEFYYARGRGGDAASPTVLLIHGDQSDARDLLPLAQAVSGAGYNVMALSQPGYGLSGGRPDMMGPATLRAVEAALAALKHTRGVDSTRIAVWGVERGGTLAARLAMTRSDIVGAIATRGVYDLPALARTSKSFHAALVAEVGRDSVAWHERSPVSLPPRVLTPLLLESNPSDTLVPSTQSQTFAYTLTAAGQPVESQLLVGADRAVPTGAARDTALAFLARAFQKR